MARYQYRSTGIANSKKSGTLDILKMCRIMKEEGLTADIIIYNNLLACVAEDCLVLEAWAIVEDMTSMGVAPDRHTFNHLIYVRSSSPFHSNISDHFATESRHLVGCSRQLCGRSWKKWMLQVSILTDKHSS